MTIMSTVPDRTTFETAYAGQAPWDIGRPQPAFVAVADRITGAVLDAGCGTGDNALYFAGRGCTVTGIDFLAEASVTRNTLHRHRLGRGVSWRFVEMSIAERFRPHP
jgi:methylase of polypeptide subunit release factors